MAFTENLDPFLADFGVPVSFTGAPTGTVGIVDFHDVLLALLGVQQLAEVIGRQRVVLVKTTVAALLAVDQPITVGGVPYLVVDPSAESDGAFSVVTLTDAS